MYQRHVKYKNHWKRQALLVANKGEVEPKKIAIIMTHSSSLRNLLFNEGQVWDKTQLEKSLS